ncbi:AEC family transporter [Calothrix sp. FACHB-1219]|uniref:AEC family transporter n=1 Tax=unclassified Calothrix TaxID=2619626 RepID=UPI0016888CD1|nr:MULTISPECIES: AEC family transporter [unclassified Calothrix]MBD2205248.1 AEC family transporter [Calothrix sp. FACHB-168]MBD2220022.1 AEC family transporter [Calothrix sp. FACHB-1219]
MIENLVNAYTPLFTWIGLGMILSRFIPDSFLKLLGYMLYWVGVPLQLFVLARHTDSSHGGLIPAIAVLILIVSLVLASLIGWGLQFLAQRQTSLEQTNIDLPSVKSLDRASLGSFILATILGNTGFVGLTLAQVLTGPANMDWAVLFSVTNNVVGTYGIAVLIASYFGNRQTTNHWWIQLRDLVTVPSLWTFFIGLNTKFIKLPAVVESGLEQAVWVVIAFALLLVGLRMQAMKGWKNFQMALVASLLKVLIVPLLVGLCATYLGIIGEQRLVLVLMSGTPTGLSVLILAEVYDLDRSLLASSIALSFVGLLLALPLWLVWFS